MDEPTQPAEPTAGAKRSRGFAGCVVWGFVIVVLYFLSAGPVYFIWIKGGCSYSALPVLSKIYAPWNWAYWHTPIHKPLGMYMHLWCPERFNKLGDHP